MVLSGSSARKISPKAPALVSQVNRVSTGNSGPSSESRPAIAKTATSTTASALWVREPATGA